jgi:hypothetical protein
MSGFGYQPKGPLSPTTAGTAPALTRSSASWTARQGRTAVTGSRQISGQRARRTHPTRGGKTHVVYPRGSRN